MESERLLVLYGYFYLFFFFDVFVKDMHLYMHVIKIS